MSIETIRLNGINYEISGPGGAIPGENVISETEADNVEYIANGTWIDNIYINNGVEQTNTGYKLSAEIPATEETDITLLSTRDNYRIYLCCWDANGTWLGRVDSGYTTANVPLVVNPKANTAKIKINVTNNVIASGYCAIIVPMSVTTYDWQDTPTSRMNPLAVRSDIYSKIADIEAILWNYRKWYGKTVVVDGNSLVGVGGWGESLASFLGMTCVNLGRSGQGLTFGTNNAQGQAVYPNVWTAETIIERVTNDYPANVDLIILQGDSNSSAPDGSVTDQMDGSDPKTTWYAKINYLIRCLKAKYPNVIIVIMPDQVRYDGAVKAHELTLNHVSLTTMREVAEYNRLAFYDFEHATPFNPLHDTNWYSRKGQKPDLTQDYVHASGTGGQWTYGRAKGKALAGFVSQLIFDPNAPSAAIENWTSLI